MPPRPCQVVEQLALQKRSRQLLQAIIKIRTLGDDGNYTSLSESEGINRGASASGNCGNTNYGTLCDSNESYQHHPLKISVTAGQTYWLTVYMNPISDGVPGNEYFLTVTGS